MTVSEFTAIIVALTGLVAAVGALAGAVHGYHKQVNSRMDELLRLTASSSHAAGRAERRRVPRPTAESAAPNAAVLE
jgi:hypothetical protein